MEQENKLSFLQFLNTLRWSFAFQMKLSPVVAVLKVAVIVFIELEPLVYAYIFARLLDVAIGIAGTGAEPQEIIPALGLLFGYNIISSAVNHSNYYLSSVLSTFNNFKTPYYFYQHIHSLGIQTLEVPDVVNKIQRSKETLNLLNQDFERGSIFFAKIITLLVAALVIVKMMPIFTGIIILTVIPGMLSSKYFLQKQWRLWRNETENRRRARNIFDILIETINLQEIFITSAYGYLSCVYRKYTDYFATADLKILRKWRSYGFLFGLLTSSASIAGYFIIFKNFLKGLISVGDVTFQIRSLNIFISNLTSMSGSYTALRERSIRIAEIKEVFEMKPNITDGAVVLPENETPPYITLKNVSFAYPRAETNVIKNLNLEIKPGEKIAIVGENGAGKTTLVRILSRFYKVSEGEILLDSTNINDIKIESWYKNLGVLFQDYNTYSPLTLKENIHLGNAHEKLDEERMIEAANKANVNSFLANFKNGYDQVLSEKFKGGTRPSTGQWQKIAIARFFYRNSPVVIFDEPTASIDAVSESEIFGQIYDFFKGKTVIIISHRFSTVRNADKIYVLDKGEIIESGSHDELMARKGKYHHAFTIQAEGYRA